MKNFLQIHHSTPQSIHLYRLPDQGYTVNFDSIYFLGQPIPLEHSAWQEQVVSPNGFREQVPEFKHGSDTSQAVNWHRLPEWPYYEFSNISYDDEKFWFRTCLNIPIYCLRIPWPGLQTHSNGELEVNGSKFSHIVVPVSLQGSSLVKQALSSRSHESPAKSAVHVQVNEPFLVTKTLQKTLA